MTSIFEGPSLAVIQPCHVPFPHDMRPRSTNLQQARLMLLQFVKDGVAFNQGDKAWVYCAYAAEKGIPVAVMRVTHHKTGPHVGWTVINLDRPEIRR